MGDQLTRRRIARVAIYCGSNAGRDPAYLAAASDLGRHVAGRGIGIVYGGTHKGLMGAMADGAISAGGTLHGVITERLRAKGHLHPALSGWECLPTMRQRKARMIDLVDGIIGMPGGIGTLEEVLEAWTLNQLGEIDKPLGLLNARDYFNTFMRLVDHMIEEGFLPPTHRETVIVEENAGRLIDRMIEYVPVTTPKWMS